LELSKTQIDRLGDRLREGSPTDADLISLDEYRLSFGTAYETVVRNVRQELHLEPTGRPAKSTSSLLDKLNRESIRLTQVQDIAGCRIIVNDILEQERVVNVLRSLFPHVSVVDRRDKSSYGYRAMHVIVNIADKLVEIQVRTSLQHEWAELSEKWSDVVDPGIKYGGGPAAVRSLLQSMSDTIANIEEVECDTSNVRIAADDNALSSEIDDDEREELQKQMDDLDLRVLGLKRNWLKKCKDLMAWLDQDRDSRR
jgi:putative GTP pyrophosphokinase